MASRFWNQGDSDTEEDSDTENVVLSPTAVRSRYLQGNASDDDNSDAHERVVRSVKDKCFSEMYATVADVNSSMKINDWVNLQDCFEKINKLLEKFLRVTESKEVPHLYVKALVMFEDFLTKTLADRDWKKKMSSSNHKAFNSMNKKMKKNNKQYEDLINEFRKNPENKAEDEGDDDLKQEPVMDNKMSEKTKHTGKRALKNESRITWETVDKKLKGILAAWARKGVGTTDQVEQLSSLIELAGTPAQKVEILTHIISAQLDVNSALSSHLPLDLWRNCVRNLFAIIDILVQYPNIVVDNCVKPEGNETRKGSNYKGPIRVRGDVVAFFERLNVEFVKRLQFTDAHAYSYVDRLGDELLFLALAQNLQAHLERKGNSKAAAKVALKQVELLYCKTLEAYDAMRTLAENTELEIANASRSLTHEVVSRRPSLPQFDPKFMDTLLSLVYKFGDVRSKARAMVCDMHHQAILDDFIASRDVLLLSRLQDNVPHMDISTQTLYYRAMAQLGLCAFKSGLIDDAHRYVSELFEGRAKELVSHAVSQSQYHGESSEQVPHFVDMNLELFETIHLTCAMLLEVPNMFLKRDDGRPYRFVSNALRRLLDTTYKQALTGPPKNLKDHISAAARSLSRSDYENAFEIMSSLSIWKLLRNQETVLEMLKSKMKEAALRAYLLNNSLASESLDLDRLGRTFDLSDSEMRSVIEKMISMDEVQARWDSGCVIFYYVQRRSMQALSSQLAERLMAVAV